MWTFIHDTCARFCTGAKISSWYNERGKISPGISHSGQLFCAGIKWTNTEPQEGSGVNSYRYWSYLVSCTQALSWSNFTFKRCWQKIPLKPLVPSMFFRILRLNEKSLVNHHMVICYNIDMLWSLLLNNYSTRACLWLSTISYPTRGCEIIKKVRGIIPKN